MKTLCRPPRLASSQTGKIRTKTTNWTHLHNTQRQFESGEREREFFCPRIPQAPSCFLCVLTSSSGSQTKPPRLSDSFLGSIFECFPAVDCCRAFAPPTNRKCDSVSMWSAAPGNYLGGKPEDSENDSDRPHGSSRRHFHRLISDFQTDKDKLDRSLPRAIFDFPLPRLMSNAH